MLALLQGFLKCLSPRGRAVTATTLLPRPAPAALTQPSPQILDFLRALPAGSIVVQHDDGSLEVCADLESAEACFDPAACGESV